MEQSGRKPSVLVIEDDPEQREIMVNLLIDRGFDVFQSEDGKDGFLIALTRQIDAAITDLHMEEGNGFQFLELIKKKRPDIPVILVTGHPDSLAYSEAREHATAIFTKPLDYEEVIRTLVQSLERKAA